MGLSTGVGSSQGGSGGTASCPSSVDANLHETASNADPGSHSDPLPVEPSTPVVAGGSLPSCDDPEECTKHYDSFFAAAVLPAFDVSEAGEVSKNEPNNVDPSTTPLKLPPDLSPGDTPCMPTNRVYEYIHEIRRFVGLDPDEELQQVEKDTPDQGRGSAGGPNGESERLAWDAPGVGHGDARGSEGEYETTRMRTRCGQSLFGWFGTNRRCTY